MANNLEQVDTGTSGVGTAAAQTMSDQIFADPKAFLAALKSDFSTLDVRRSGEIEQADLQDYVQNGNDAGVRAVAQAALNHYGEIKAFRDYLPSHSVETHGDDGLALADVQLVDDAVNGQPQSYIARENAHDRSKLHWDVGLSVACGMVTGFELAVQNYWIAALTGTAAGVRAIDAYDDYQKLQTQGPLITEEFAFERNAVAHWREFQHK